jgi:hypothetical protein
MNYLKSPTHLLMIAGACGLAYYAYKRYYPATFHHSAQRAGYPLSEFDKNKKIVDDKIEKATRLPATAANTFENKKI